jgi:hypothetical protein
LVDAILVWCNNYITMVRTQIQLPDDLYGRAKRFAEAREMSLAEVARRGIETLLEQYPPPERVRKPWKLPVVNLGEFKVPLEKLKEIAADEETFHSLPERGE